MTDINAVIAVHRGWKIDESNCCYWRSVDGKYEVFCPDFQHDARLYMPLFEEMANNVSFEKVSQGYIVCEPIKNEPAINILGAGDTIGTAICLAYCKLNGLECE